MHKIIIFLCTLTLIGCASSPTEEQLQNADYGSYQAPRDCVPLAEARIKSTLKDPRSAIFSHSSCSKGYAPKESYPVLPVSLVIGKLGLLMQKILSVATSAAVSTAYLYEMAEFLGGASLV